MSQDATVNWSKDDMVEVELENEDSFLKVRETLTRIGIPSKREPTLYQSCHILHKQGKYYIVHFKEMFYLDGKDSTLNQQDVRRRNTVAKLLEDWGLLKVVNPEQVEDREPMGKIKIIKHSEKDNWDLVAKYSIGSTPHRRTNA